MNKSIPKEDILLIFIDLPVNREQNVMSPIQIMKGMFLVKNELKIENFYTFKPYLYGPCSFEIYSDLMALIQKNFIEMIRPPRLWNYYRTTPIGSDAAKVSMKILGAEKLKELGKIKELVMGKTFLQLLEYVYTKYPEYVENSIINVGALRK